MGIDAAVKVIQLLTPFATLLLGWWWVRKNKKDDERKATERKLAETEREKLNASLIEATEAIKKAKEEVDSLQTAMEQIRQLATISSLNGRFTSELAQLVMALAEGIRDQHLDGNITSAVARYRNFELTELGNIMSNIDSLSSKKKE